MFVFFFDELSMKLHFIFFYTMCLAIKNSFSGVVVIIKRMGQLIHMGNFLTGQPVGQSLKKLHVSLKI